MGLPASPRTPLQTQMMPTQSEPTHWLDETRGRWQWRVRSNWLFLLDKDPPDWLNLKKDSRAVAIKASDGREVWRVELGSQLVFVKICRPGRRWARCRHLLYGPDSVGEFRVAAYAAEHGIETVCPIALADAPIAGREPNSILITAGLPHARPLNEFWAALENAHADTRCVKNELIEAVARLIAHAHQSGFGHFDLHAGNVLIDHPPDGAYRPLFVDLHNVRIGKPVSDAAVIRNLVQFNQWFRVHAPLADRIRFLDGYLDCRDACQAGCAHGRRLTCDRRELLNRLNRAVHAHAKTLYATRDHRVLRNGRYFTRIDLDNGWRGHVFLESKHGLAGSRASALRFTPEQWKELLQRPLDWLRVTDRRWLIKESPSVTVCRARLPHPAGPVDVICKRSTSRNLLRRVQSLFRPSRALLTWKRANALLHRQIPTARPLAVVERRQAGLLLDSLLITEYVDNACDLDTLLTVNMREMDPRQQRRLKDRIIASLVNVAHRLQSRGFKHRDLKAPNILVQWDPQGADPPRTVLVDLDGIRRCRRPDERAATRMIVRLNLSLDHCRRVTRTDRLRFLQQYLGRPGQRSDVWKSAWRKMAALTSTTRRTQERAQERKMKKYGRF